MQNEINQIIIRDLKFYGFHGVYPEEQVVGTTFRADVVVDIGDLPGFATDRLEDSLNYEHIVERILSIGTGRKYRLVERLVQAIAEEILAFPQALCVDVTVYKSVRRLTPEPQWIGVRRVLRQTHCIPEGNCAKSPAVEP